MVARLYYANATSLIRLQKSSMSTASVFVPSPHIGLVGLGLVGTALAKRLSLAGYGCIGFDIRPEATKVFESSGFEVATSVASLLEKTNTLVLAVFDTKGVLDVVSQIVQHQSDSNQVSPQPLVLIDCSTGDPLKLAELAKQLALNNIQLIEASTDNHLWAEQYERETKDIFALQLEVAKNIANQIELFRLLYFLQN